MTSLLAFLALATGQAEAPRLRTVLPNGAAILVERMPQERLVSVQLWASSRGVEETPRTHGLRHLLEHLLAIGPGRDLDTRLETAGGSLRARTYRDATQVEVLVPRTRLPVAFEALREVLQPLRATAEWIEREARVVEQEMAFEDLDDRMTSAAWKAAYGELGLDPLGDLEVLRASTPAELENLRRRHFSSRNLALVIAGPVDLDAATREARGLLAGVVPIEAGAQEPRSQGSAGDAVVRGSGEGRAAAVPGLGSPETVATLAAALAVGSEVEGAFVVYTPSAQNGLITVGSDRAGLAELIDGLEAGRAAALFPRGQALARAWVERPLRTASGTAYLRGLMLCQGVAYRPETMLENIAKMTQQEFLRGFARLRKEQAVVLEGTG